MQRPIEEDDVYKALKAHECSTLSARFSELWEEEKKKRRPQLFNVIRKIYAKKIIAISILFTAIDAISRWAYAALNHPKMILQVFIFFIFSLYYYSQSNPASMLRWLSYIFFCITIGKGKWKLLR